MAFWTASLSLSKEELFEWTRAFRAHGLEIAWGDATPSADLDVWRDHDAIVVADRSRALEMRLSPSILASDAAVIAALVVRVSQLRVYERTALEAGLLAHDARSVLQAMLLNAELLAGAMPYDAQPFARELVEGCVRVAQMLAQLRGAPRAEPRALDVHDVVRGLAPTLQALAGTRPLRLRFVPSSQVVLIDASDLERALVNLVVNARDASPQGADILVATRVVDARWVVISVDDRGRGMDDATRARALEPFFTTKPLGEGSGLGLTSVREVMERAGGHVRIDSTPGAGTRVELWLPTLSPAD